MNERKGQAGFTLLELLVVLVVVSLAALLTSGVIRFVSFGGELIEEARLLSESELELDRLLRREMRSVFQDRRSDTGDRPIWFDGNEREITYSAVGESGVERHRLSLKEPGKLALLTGRLEGREHVFTVEGASFAYFGLKAGQKEARWHENWHDQPAPPNLIRLSRTGAFEIIAHIPAIEAAR